MEIKVVNEKKDWKEFPSDKFLQSWEWGEFQEEGLGKDVFRLSFYSEGKRVAVCLCIQEVGRFGNFIYCPRGPVLDWSNFDLVNSVLKSLISFFKNKGYVFLRIDPSIKEGLVGFKDLGFRDSKYFSLPIREWFLDIEGRSDEDLLLGMRKKSRYALKKAIKSDLKVEFSSDPEDFDEFIKLLQNLAKKKGFHALPSSYLKSQFKIMEGIMKFLCVKKDGEMIAGGWFSFFGDESSYIHGASSSSVGSSGAPYLLQWEAIKYARDLGLKRHNFWGVVEEKKYNPSYAGFGFSSFKKGFGGYMMEYIWTKDFVYNSFKYNFFYLNDLYRRLRDRSN